VYHHSTRTPWIVRWPGRVKPNSVDRKHMISAIDFMPTVLDIVGLPLLGELEGRSFLPLLEGAPQAGRDWVVKEYNENSGGHRHPMRSIETRRYGYIFNPWANGKLRFRTATQGTRTYKLMQSLAETDEAIAARLHQFDYRCVEEFYDYESDPDALNNLIDDPKCQDEISRLRSELEQWMIETGDPCLEALRNRDNPEALEQFIKAQQDASNERRKQKRKGRKKKSDAKLIRVVSPTTVTRGAPTVLTVEHKLTAEHGEQLLHVTLKTASNKRIERKVLKVKGTGKVDVSFDVPDDAALDGVVFAAFVGKDFPNCLQHVVTKAVPVK